MTKNELKALGFTSTRVFPLGTEQIATYTAELESKLKELGFTKTWGFEGGVDTYAIFTSDVDDQDFYGQKCISVIAEKEVIGYNTVIFLQGEEAEEALSILEEVGEEEVVKHLSQWDNGEHDDISTDPFGVSGDTVTDIGEYTLSYNKSLGYISLATRV